MPHLPGIACHPKGTFALQGIIAVLKDFPERQAQLLTGLKGSEGKLFRNKDGSDLIKKIFVMFDKSLLVDLTAKFLQELRENVTNKYSICIFKEIINIEADHPDKFNRLISDFLHLFPVLKLDTCYHFGLQYLIDVRACN